MTWDAVQLWSEAFPSPLGPVSEAGSLQTVWPRFSSDVKEFPYKQNGEQSKIYLSEKSATTARRGAPREGTKMEKQAVFFFF